MTVAERMHLDPRTAAYADEVVAQIEATVPLLEAFLLGSAATGGFRPGESDLDLTAVIERPLGSAKEVLLRRLRAPSGSTSRGSRSARARTSSRSIPTANGR